MTCLCTGTPPCWVCADPETPARATETARRATQGAKRGSDTPEVLEVAQMFETEESK